jgi:signal transduction histidine kinase
VPPSSWVPPRWPSRYLGRLSDRHDPAGTVAREIRDTSAPARDGFATTLVGVRIRVAVAWTAVALCGAGLALVVRVESLAPGSQGNGGPAAAAVALVWAATGALLVTARPRNWVGWLLVLVGVLQGAANVGIAYGGYGVRIADPNWPAARWVAQFTAMIYLPSLVLPATVLLALYPEGRLPSRRWRWPVAAVVVGLTTLTLGATLSQEAYDDIAPGPAPLALSKNWWTVSASVAAAVMLLGGAATIWVASAIRLARSRSPERQQLAWYVAVVVPLILGGFVLPIPGLVVGAAFSLPLAVAIGVVRYRMLGIVLRPALVYGSLTAVVVGAYFAVTALAASGLDRGPLPGMLVAALVAAGLAPVRDHIQRGVDRFVYGERRDPLRAVSRLSDSVSTETDLLPAVLGSVTSAVRAPGAAVLDTGGRTLAGTVLEPADRIPLRVGGTDVGTLQLAWRTPTAPYTQADRKLLAALVPQVAVVVRALELAESLEAARDRLLAVTSAERDRYRRDLHDGLGPSLSGIRLGLDIAAKALRSGDPVKAAPLVEAAAVEAARSTEEVRRIIDDFRPAALEDSDLGAAIRHHAEKMAPGVLVQVRTEALRENARRRGEHGLPHRSRSSHKRRPSCQGIQGDG